MNYQDLYEKQRTRTDALLDKHLSFMTHASDLMIRVRSEIHALRMKHHLSKETIAQLDEAYRIADKGREDLL